MNTPRRLCLAAALVAAGCARPAFTYAQAATTPAAPLSPPLAPDAAALDATERLLREALDDSADAGQIMGALRGSGDPALAPFFHRIGAGKNPMLQMYGVVAENFVSKDPRSLDIQRILTCRQTDLIGPAIASVIDYGSVTDDQLKAILNDAPDSNQQMMAASELVRRKVPLPPGTLDKLSNSVKDTVRAYAAVTQLQFGDTSAKPLSILHDLAQKSDPDAAHVQSLLLLRIRDQKVTGAEPFVRDIFQNANLDERLRFSALSVLLTLKDPQAPRLLADQIREKARGVKDPDTGKLQPPAPGPLIKLGLLSIEFADQLQPADLEPLQVGDSDLQHAIGKIAVDASNGGNPTTGILDLMKEGHPIVLEWALSYSDRCEPRRALSILKEMIDESTTVDDAREQDYEHAAAAATRLAHLDTPAARAALTRALKAPGDAIVEATLAGLSRSDKTDLADLLLPLWPQWSAGRPSDTITNYAALILARDNHPEPAAWLATMARGGPTSNPGLRALAGWYYAKLTNQSAPLLKRVLAAKPKS